MYRALYRKYRPAAFADVVGQPHITQTLKNQLSSGRVSHAYLFTGSRGTGKTSCAKILARAVNCLDPRQGDPCGGCEICRDIENDVLTDVLEIDAASNNGVNNIRDLREQVSFLPAKAKYRVYIIDEVHMLTSEAFNALLKTLEEPPEHVIFILATTEVHKLPATILSRCQRFDFHRIEPDAICARLLDVAHREGLDLASDAALSIAALADGGMRDALSILDLCAAHGQTITEDDVVSVCGLAGRTHVFELADRLHQADAAGALTALDRLHNASVDMQRLCAELCEHYRNLMIVKTVADPKRLIPCTTKDLERYWQQAKSIPLDTVLFSLRVLQNAADRMRRGNRRSEMELALLSLCNPAFSDDPAALAARLSRLEAQLEQPQAARPAPPASVSADAGHRAAVPATPEAAAESKLEPVPEDLPAAGSASEPTPAKEIPEASESQAQSAEKPPPSNVGGEEPLARWPDVLRILQKTCPLMFGVLQGSQAYLTDGVLRIDSKNTQFQDLIRGESSYYRDQIRDAAAQALGAPCKVGVYQRTQPSAQSDPLARLAAKLKELEGKER